MVLTAIWMLCPLLLAAQENNRDVSEGNDTTAENQEEDMLRHMDSVTISLLTVGPGQEVWSLYGHTALRYEDRTRNVDVAINYGAFTFEQDFFVVRFVFGLTDYEMATVPMNYFIAEYRDEQRWVVQQELNLTATEKLAITKALYENSLPENVVYRYNFFYDNCTTRARDMILNHLNGSYYYTNNKIVKTSYRKMVHEWNEDHRWTRFGNDLLLGIQADFTTDHEARQFLPDRLRKDFELCYVREETDKESEPATVGKAEQKAGRRLVGKTTYLLSPAATNSDTTDKARQHPMGTPRMVFAGLLALVAGLTVCQWWKKKNFWIVDAFLLTATGLAGVVLFLMLFSQHPTVRINLQILVLNPLSLLMCFSVLKAGRKQQSHRYWKVLTGCIALFLVGGIWQTYAEGMYFVALSLLIRCMANSYIVSPRHHLSAAYKARL